MVEEKEKTGQRRPLLFLFFDLLLVFSMLEAQRETRERKKSGKKSLFRSVLEQERRRKKRICKRDPPPSQFSTMWKWSRSNDDDDDVAAELRGLLATGKEAPRSGAAKAKVRI